MTGTAYVTPMADGHQTTIAAGVGILATLAAMTFWFWIAISVIAAINPPDFDDLLSGDGYMSTPRMLIALVIAVAGTIGTWTLARMSVEA